MKPSHHEDVRARLRNQPSPVRYDVERGLARHRQLVRNNAPLPTWADELPTVRRAGWLRRLGWLSGVSIVAAVAAVAALRRAPEPSVPTATEHAPAVQPHVSVEPASEREARVMPPARVHSVDTHVALPAANVQPPVVEPPVPTSESLRPPASQPKHRTASARAEAAATASKREHGPRSAQVEAPQDNVELQQLVAAERALPGDPLRALRLAREGELNFRSGYFAQERRYIEVMALFSLGRLGEAHAQAAAFLRDYPSAPYRRKVELEVLRQPQH